MDALTKKEFNDALINLRKAHRLIFAYQDKMLDLVHFIGHQLGFTSLLGNKFFSEPIRAKRNGYLDVVNGMWAWDFLYSYVFEYYLGEILLDNEDKCALSIIQYADTGFYDIEDLTDKKNIDNFELAENSDSKLLFIFELKSKKAKEWIWDIGYLVEKKEYAFRNHTKTIIDNKKGNVQLLCSFSMDNFLNEKSTLNAINQFAEFCEKEANVILRS